MSGMSQKQPLKLEDLDEITLTAGQAFLALGRFLHGYSDRTKGGGDIATLCSGVHIEGDRMSGDPAALSDWLEDVNAVLAKDNSLSGDVVSGVSQKQPLKLENLNGVMLTASQGFLAMGGFLLAYFERTNGMGPARTLVGDVEIERDGRSTDPAALSDWAKAVHEVLEERGYA